MSSFLLHRAAVLCTIVAALAIGAPVGAEAATEAPAATVTWAVRPSDGQVADGRTKIELELDPGESVDEHLIVTNLGDVAARFALSAADGYYTSQGRFNMLPADQPSVDAGTWIRLDSPDVELAPDESAVIDLRVTVPTNATPGDHPAGVAASLTTTANAADGSSLGVESRVGFRVMTRVTGELAPALELTDMSARYDLNWNPFAPGAVAVTYTAQNAGNTRLEVDRVAKVAGRETSSDDHLELFPGDARQVSAQVQGVWPFGFATVRVDASGRVVPDSTTAATAAASREITVWTIPWPQLAVLAGIGLIVFAIVYGRRRRTAEIERLIAGAREQGAREAVARSSGESS